MPVWRRYLVREQSGQLTELPSRKYDHADDGVAPIPDYAGRCVDIVAAVMIAEGAEAPRVAEVEFTKLYFDSVGFIDARKRERMVRLMLESCADRRCRSMAQPGCTDANLRASSARVQLASEFGWQPGPAEVHEVLHRLDVRPLMAVPRTVH